MDDRGGPAGGDLEDLLRRFRETGDPVLAGAFFDRTSAGLFRLALTLAPDEASAEDALQESFLVLLEELPRLDLSRPVLPWLAGVLRHKVADVRRRRGRAGAFPAEAESASPGPEGDAARREEERRVRDALDALPEPYRMAALLRWRHGLEPAEIAHLLGERPGTVRVTLHRAMRRLKVALTALPSVLFRAERPPRGLGTVRQALLREARRAGVSSAAAGTAVAAGGILVAKKTVAAVVALLLLGALGAWVAGTEGPGEAGAGDSARVAAAPAVATGGSRSAIPPASPDGTGEDGPGGPAPPAAARVPVRWVLRGRLTTEGGTVPGGVAVVVVPVEESSGDEVEGEARAATVEGGEFVADVTALMTSGVPVGWLEVRVDERPAWMPEARRASVREAKEDAGGRRILAIEVPLRRALVLEGSVVDGEGRPVVGAPVGVFVRREGEAPEACADAWRTDGEGRYRLRLPEHAAYLVVAAAPGLAPAAVAVTGGDQEAPRLVLRAASAISGKVVLGDGTALVGATVRAGAAGAASSVPLPDASVQWAEGRVRTEEADAVTDGAGRFRIAGLEPGPHEVRVEEAGEPWLMQDLREATGVRAEAPASDLLLRLASSRLIFEARDGDRPVAGARLDLTGRSAEDEPCMTGLSLGPAGRREVRVRPGGRYEVRVTADGFAPWSREVIGPPEAGEATVRAELAPPATAGVVAVRLRLPPGTVLDHCAVAVDAPEEERPWGELVRGEGNRFRVTGVEPGRYRVVARPGGEWLGSDSPWLPVEGTVDVEPGRESEVVLEPVLGGRFRIAARAEDGRLLAARCVLLDAAGRRLPAYFTARSPGGSLSAHGAALSVETACIVDPALPAGKYRFDLSHEGFADRSVEAVVEAGRTTEVDVVLRP